MNTQLKIPFERLSRNEGRRLNITVLLTAEWLTEAFNEGGFDATGGESLEFWVELSVQGTEVLARGQLRGMYEVPCARCVEPAEVDACADVFGRFVRGYRDQAGAVDEDGVELDETELDEQVYDGKVIDLAPVVKDQLLLSYPISAFCSLGEACRGLCGRCGSNLNEASANVCPNCKPIVDNDIIAGTTAASTESGGSASSWKAALAKIGKDE